MQKGKFMKVSSKDKRIKAIMKGHPTPVVSVRGLPRGIAPKIQLIITQLIAAQNLSMACSANPQWRCHQWKGKSTWSIDVQGSTRLLFDYDNATHEISGMVYDDPH